MGLIHIHVYVIQVIVDQTVMKVQTSFIHLIICFKINCSNINIKGINDCEPDPCTHGSCADGVNSYTCVCDPGYSAANCNESTVLSIYLFGLQ